MTLDFDPQPPKEPQEVLGRLCRWVADADDELFGGYWEPLPGSTVTPIHKKGSDPVLQAIKKRESYFRKMADRWLVQQGCVLAYRVDRYNQYAGRTFDLYGLFDREGARPHPVYADTDETILVQFTSRSNLGAHMKKMCAHEAVSSTDKRHRVEYLRDFLRVGRKVVLLGFFKDGSRWAVEERWITMADVDSFEPRTRRKKIG